MTAKSQSDLFAQAMKSFTSGDYRAALEVFDQASQGPSIAVNESAQMYRRMCQQRIDRATPQLKTPEDHYNFGVSLMNAGKFADARKYLETAVDGGPESHHLYALAIVEGMTGAIDSAVRHLRKAIQVDRGLRNVARTDADFQPLLQHAQIREVLAGDPYSAE
ncbi:tetratricopeptide repeat protein [Paludibaculum fermentans]|uniref:tetratricopeptide repeat protein n=1 Tax=Paludibaculum fermentans TaxID=1473598 RepID=UPI003EC02385